MRRVARFVAATVAAATIATVAFTLGATSAEASETYTTIANRFNSKCLDAEAFSGWNGTKVQLWDCNGGPQQQWSFEYSDFSGYYMIRNRRFPNMCLNADNSAGTYPNGARVQLWSCTARTSNAAWRFGNYMNGAGTTWYFMNTAANGGMYLDGDVSQGDVNGMQVQMWQGLGPYQYNQHWTCSAMICPR